MFFWEAFWVLSTDRHLGFNGEGPIPFTAIERYATRYRLSDVDEFDRLRLIIAGMDAEYRRSAAERAQKAAEARSTEEQAAAQEAAAVAAKLKLLRRG